jgi:DNA-binding MarR family transcriptional regulator
VPIHPPIDLDVEAEQLVASQVGQAWKELRRGAATVELRGYLFGSGKDALEPGQVDTLDLLALRDWRMSELADALRVDPSTATRAVQRLTRTGLAHRATSHADGRVVMVSITPLGRERHEAIARRRRETMAVLMAEFDPGERRELASLMGRFVKALDDLAGEISTS